MVRLGGKSFKDGDNLWRCKVIAEEASACQHLFRLLIVTLQDIHEGFQLIAAFNFAALFFSCELQCQYGRHLTQDDAFQVIEITIPADQ